LSLCGETSSVCGKMCYITHFSTHRTCLPTKTQPSFNIAICILNNVGLTRNNKFSFSNIDSQTLNSNFVLFYFVFWSRFVCTSLIITAELLVCCVKSSSCWANNPRCYTTQLHCTNENPLYQAPYTKALLQNNLTTGNPSPLPLNPIHQCRLR